MYIDSQQIKKFFEEMNQSGVHYVLIKNIKNELPDELINGKDIDILVLLKDKLLFENVMVTNEYKRIIHPLGSENGWQFAYNLPECQFWKKEKIEQELFIDTTFKLCCKSLMPNIWIPLDKYINNDIWNNRIFDEKNNWWILDEETEVIYLVVRSIFDKNNFSANYIYEIEKRKKILYTLTAKSKLQKIFFAFTDKLLELIEQEKYDNIIETYISFRNY